MSESHEGPETFYGNKSRQEISDFIEKHTSRMQVPREPSFLRRLFGPRGTQTVVSIKDDREGRMNATRAPSMIRNQIRQEPEEKTTEGPHELKNGRWVPKK